MTPEERFERIEKNQLLMQEQLIVHARMQEEMEKRWMDRTDQMFDAVGAIGKSQALTLTAVDSLRQVVENTNTVVDHLAARVEDLADKQATTQSALDSLIATVDKFIKGSGKGQPQG